MIVAVILFVWLQSWCFCLYLSPLLPLYSMSCWLFHPTTPTFPYMNNVFYTFMPDDREYAYTQCCFAPLRHCFELLGKLMFFYMFLFCYWFCFNSFDNYLQIISICSILAFSMVSHRLLCSMDGYIRHFSVDHSCLCLDLVNIGICLSFHIWELIDFFSNNDDSLCYRWPYPFLDLSSPFAPLWYAMFSQASHCYWALKELQSVWKCF